jgi:cell pole-organizing protein PopZ
MEDILASIKRIIAEDSEVAAPRPARPIRREMASVPVDFEPVPTETEAKPAEVEAKPEVKTASEAKAAPEIEVAPEIEADVEGADVLELTSPLAEDVPPAPEPQAMPAKSEELRPVQAKPLRSKPTRTETAPSDPIQPPREPVSIMDRLLSDPAAQASRNAFAALTQLQVRAEDGKENTLEGLVADMLRPMLREWLDRELPAMVERMVADEIGRVSGRA